MNAPKYFLSVFGDPKPPDKDTVESGIYHPNPKFVPFPTDPGDFLILYCTSGYLEYSMCAPGIGVVLDTTETEIYYRYLPFTKPISKDELDINFELVDKKKLSNIRFSTYWLFEISRHSFLATIGDRRVLLP